ncbi:MAG: lipopolysaccharide core heptose(I) kinase RfaP [Victivallaceae bacterium]|nr:lipopolysaccharide core heptose(I) kinase RfaP [Victivallaceae bacterium]
MTDIREPLLSAWRGRDPFDVLWSLEGEEFRRVKSRRTFRFEVCGEGFFAKVHRGVGYREIAKNLLMFKLPVVGAANEYRALTLLKELAIPTMEIAAFGCRGVNPAKRDSFLVTRELKAMKSLEDISLEWRTRPPEPALRFLLIRRLAESAGAMHRGGINHRDCYLCHYLCDLADPRKTLYVIDLHRAQCRKRVPRRYLVKDVAGLLFSAMDKGIGRRDVFRFIRYYSGRPLKEEWRRNAAFYRAVAVTAEKLFRKEFGVNPPVWF